MDKSQCKIDVRLQWLFAAALLVCAIFILGYAAKTARMQADWRLSARRAVHGGSAARNAGKLPSGNGTRVLRLGISVFAKSLAIRSIGNAKYCADLT